MTIIQNVRGQKRNILIQNGHVFVNGIEVFGEEAKKLHDEASKKMASKFGRIQSTGLKNFDPRDVVVIQQAGKIVNISGNVTVDANGKMKITSPSRKK